MSEVRSRDGTSIAYDRLGPGDKPPIILVDGAFCSRSFGPMPKLAPLLARDLTVFTASLKMPTLVISGDNSLPVLREAARQLAEVIPGARLRTLPGQTHNVAPKALAPVLKEFFVP